MQRHQSNAGSLQMTYAVFSMDHIKGPFRYQKLFQENLLAGRSTSNRLMQTELKENLAPWVF
jgi:hypothetical protein